MTKRLVEIDDDLLARARAVSGAATIKGTVEVALRRLVDEDMVLRHVDRLRDGGLDLGAIEETRTPRGAPDG